MRRPPFLSLLWKFRPWFPNDFSLLWNGMLWWGTSCDKGYLDIATLLIEKGCNINEKDNDGYTPLHIACNKGNLDMVKLLIEKGCNINEKNNNGNTPLHTACYKRHLDIVTLLIEKGCIVNIKSKGGETPLMFLLSPNNEIKKLLFKEIKKEKLIIEIFNKSRIILLSKEKGYFSKLTFELIVYIFYFLQHYPYHQYLSYQQVKLICQYSSQKKTLGLLTKKKLIQSIKLNL